MALRKIKGAEAGLVGLPRPPDLPRARPSRPSLTVMPLPIFGKPAIPPVAREASTASVAVSKHLHLTFSTFPPKVQCRLRAVNMWRAACTAALVGTAAQIALAPALCPVLASTKSRAAQARWTVSCQLFLSFTTPAGSPPEASNCALLSVRGHPIGNSVIS